MMAALLSCDRLKCDGTVLLQVHAVPEGVEEDEIVDEINAEMGLEIVEE